LRLSAFARPSLVFIWNLNSGESEAICSAIRPINRSDKVTGRTKNQFQYGKTHSKIKRANLFDRFLDPDWGFYLSLNVFRPNEFGPTVLFGLVTAQRGELFAMIS